jgi:ABC-type glycerol-3-phosphate transport system substrate-binding protein
MKPIKLALISSALCAVSASAAFADCGIESGSVRILSNDFPALHAVNDGAAACASGAVEVTINQTADHNDIQVAALTANPAQYTVAVVANSSIVSLLNEDLIRPLDDLVDRFGGDLSPSQMIRIDGQIMAIAFMANAQHLFYRSDILEQAGVEPPQTYEEVLVAAEAIRSAGIMENPFSFNSKAGWNLAEEFVNMYLGFGGEFFEPGTAQPSINNETGVATLNMLRSLTEYASPDFLTLDSTATTAQWEGGEAALATLWGSQGSAILDEEGSTPEIVASTVLIGAPTVGGGSIPASTLWWDGFTIASNISDEDAEASFLAMLNGISPENIAANNDKAVWLSDAFTPGAAAVGVAETSQGGARPYPMIPYMGILHGAIGDNLSEFLQGSESAEQALSDIEAAYIAAAREQGFL